MGVNVQRGGFGMAQGALHDLDIVPGSKRGHGVGVAQVMEPGVREANGNNHLLEVPERRPVGPRPSASFVNTRLLPFCLLVPF